MTTDEEAQHGPSKVAEDRHESAAGGDGADAPHGAVDVPQTEARSSSEVTTSSSSSAPGAKAGVQPSRSSSRISARRSKQAAVAAAAAEAERRVAAGTEAAAVVGTPLWRQLRAALEEKRRRGETAAREREAKLAKQQRILRHIVCTRLAQDLSPVFAILRGPTIRPYRMEELSLTLGRITLHHRDVDLGLDSRNAKISRVHARIVYDRGQGCYCIVNLSKNGVKVKQGDKFVNHLIVGVPIPLPNPATIDIQGTLLYFQVFFVTSSSGGHCALNGDSEDAKKKGGKHAAANNKRKRGQGVTYSEMIQTALRALGGAATQPKITRYIQDHFKEDIAGRTTWRNSVSGVLSANPLFIQEAIISECGRKDRKSLWRLKGAPLSAAVAAAVTADDDDDDEDNDEESVLVMDEDGEEQEGDAEQPEQKRQRTDHEEEGAEENEEEEE